MSQNASLFAFAKIAMLTVVVCLPADNNQAADRSRDRASNSTAENKQAGESERQRNAVSAMLALLGIVIVGVAFLSLVVLWGHRIRRMAREPIAKQSRPDELWYLKPRKQARKSDSDEPSDSADE